MKILTLMVGLCNVLVGEHEGIGFLPNKDWLLDLELNGEYRLATRRKIWGGYNKKYSG